MQQQSYYNYAPGIDDDDGSDAVQIDSRHLPVEPRNKVQLYQSTPPQRVTYSSFPTKQSTPTQALISEDEYLELIRNTDLTKNSQHAATKSAYGYVTAAPTTAADNPYEYTTKSPFSSGEYRKYTSRTHVPLAASSPVPHLQPQTSVQQIVRQSPHYASQPAYVTGPSQEFAGTDNRETVRVNLKKYHESTGKTKYTDPARGQYHQEVSVKPTKKLVQYATTPQAQFSSSNQQSIIQSQPLHYQSVQQISQSDKSSQSQVAQPQSQYSIVVPQAHAHTQQAYYPAESNHPFQAFLPQNERLIANNYGQSGPEQTNLPTGSQQSDSKPNGQPEFRIKYVHHVSPTPTPTPTPRTRFVTDNIQNQPLKYELYDTNGNINSAKEPPKIKLIPAPQHIHRPQYAEQPQFYKKVKVQPAAHVHYVPVRSQYQQPTGQSSQTGPQAQSDILIPIQPSRSTLFVAPNTGKIETKKFRNKSNICSFYDRTR